MADWLPTLLSAAGYDMTKLPLNLDGIDQWDVLVNDLSSVRTEMLHNVDGDQAALRIKDLKLIVGEFGYNGWYPPEGLTQEANSREEVASAHMFKSDIDDVLRDIGRHPGQGKPLVVMCGPKPANASTNCRPEKSPCLFNITADPCEYNNLADRLPGDLQLLRERLAYFRSTAVPPRNKPNDPAAFPGSHNGAWVPWITLTDSELLEASAVFRDLDTA